MGDCRNSEFWLDARPFLNGDTGVVAAGFNTVVDTILVRPDQQGEFKFPSGVGVAVEIDDERGIESVDDDAIVVSTDADCLRHAEDRGFRTGYLRVEGDESTPEETASLLAGCDGPDYGIVREKEVFDRIQAEQNGSGAQVVRNVENPATAKETFARPNAGGGTLLSTDDVQAVYDVGNAARSVGDDELAVESLEITRIDRIGVGERCCLDATSLLSKTEGMVVGSTADGGLFVCSEAHSPPSMSPRPFRVNAGSVHSYIWDETGNREYLTELSTGDRLLCVDTDGATRRVPLGRKKTETRPLMVVAATDGDRTIEAVLQDHCHVRLMAPDGNPLNITEASVGDEIIGHVCNSGK